MTLGERIRALRGERQLQQRQLAEKAELIERVAALAAGPARPLDNTDFTHPYRKRVARVFVARALRRIAGLPAPDGHEEEAA